MLGNVGPTQAPRGIIPTGTPAIGDVIYASSTTAWARLASSDSGKVLTAGGAGAAPSWGWPNPATMQIASQAIGDLLYASSTTAWARLADVAAGSVLVSGGVGAAPAWDNDPTLVKSDGGTTLTVGIKTQNATAAALGAQQYGPMLVSEGRGWGTGSSQSYTCLSALYCRILQSTNPIAYASLYVSDPTGNYDVARFGRLNSQIPYSLQIVSENFGTAYAQLSFGTYSSLSNSYNGPFEISSALAVGTASPAIRFYASAGSRTAGSIISWGDGASYTEQGYVRGVDSAMVIAPTARTSGTPQALVVTGAAHTGMTASTEVSPVVIDLGQTKTWAAGALATQRFVKILAPTMAFASASTASVSALVYIEKAPVQGSNATLTATHPFWIDDGEPRIDSAVALGDATDPTLGKLPTGFAAAQNEWICIWTQNGRRMIPCWAPS